MKLAISTAVSCLLLIGGNGVQGATSLRRRTNEENKNERELLGLGLFWGQVSTYRPTPEPTQQSDSPSSEPTPPKFISYFNYGQNGYPQVSQPKPYSYPEVSHNPYGHPVVYYDPYGYPVVPRTATVKPTPFATVKPTPFPTPNPTTPRTPWPTGAPTETLTDAKIICDPDNRSTFLGFCFWCQITGLDFILNGFKELEEEYLLPDDLDEMRELLCECELPNMLDLLFDSGAGTCESSGTDRNLNEPQRKLWRFDKDEFIKNFSERNNLGKGNGNADNDLFTVFAPSNNAIKSLNPFPNSKQTLRDLGAFHILVGRPALEYNDIRCDKDIKMSNGGKTKTTCQRNRNGNVRNKFQVGKGNTETEPKINQKDIYAANGIIHVIGNAVLQPK